jgi:hypothetical protein
MLLLDRKEFVQTIFRIVIQFVAYTVHGKWVTR